MKRTLTMLALAVMLIVTANAQTAAQSIDKPFIHPKWTGVWQGTLDGVPAVTLTLADDAGEANGTIVFHAIKKENGHVYSFSTEPHTLINPRVDGDMISFQVKRGNGSNEILNMTAELGKDGNVGFSCSNCGPEGSKADLQRMQ
jgi:opacity protein-like surface antigen